MSEEKTKLLVTGASGQVGGALLEQMKDDQPQLEIIAALRDVKELSDWPHKRAFDFTEPGTFATALKGIDILFLLRPPQISDVKKYFAPLLAEAQNRGLKTIVFLSVQGAESSSVIPHRKIEKLLEEGDFQYIFLRPGYFMQNLTSTLLKEIKEERRITLPAGKAKFNWVDVEDVARVARQCILSFDHFRNQALTLTGPKNLNFYSVAKLLSAEIGEQVEYRPVNPLRFYFMKRKQGLNSGFALVMIILHFLPRLQNEPEITDTIFKVTKSEPVTLKNFLDREAHRFD